MFSRMYLEITTCCNLSCSFCPGTKRPAAFLSPENFYTLTAKLRPYGEHLYLHVMGEPLLHPQLPKLLEICRELGFRATLTTNGTLLPKKQEALLAAPALRKVSVSLHSFEANEAGDFSAYLTGCTAFAHAAFPGVWQKNTWGWRLENGVFVSFGERFDWPDEQAEERGNSGRCRALSDQIAVLSDGTVVPCCLDHEGTLALGNLFRQELSDILASPLACAIREGFEKGERAAALCRLCGYAERFGSR